MVIPHKTCADIGTDHGYVPEYLYENKICESVILTDVSEGPLAIAKKNLIGCTLDDDSFRLGSGISVLAFGEANTVIIAGMGGELIQSILEDDIKKAHSFDKIIIQARTKIDELRFWLSQNGFRITEYALALENGRICEVFSVESGESELENEIISDVLINSNDDLLGEFIKRKIVLRENLISNLKNSQFNQASKIKEIEKEIKYLESIKA